MLGIGILQNPMFGDGTPGGLAYVFPDYGAGRVVIDGAFSAGFHAWAELALALGWLARPRAGGGVGAAAAAADSGMTSCDCNVRRAGRARPCRAPPAPRHLREDVAVPVPRRPSA